MAALESMKDLEAAVGKPVPQRQAEKPEGLTLLQQSEGGKDALVLSGRNTRGRRHDRSTPTSPSKAVAILLAWASLREGSSKEAR